MPFSSLAEIVLFVAFLAGIYFLLKPLQQNLEKFLKKFFRRHPKQDEIIDVTPKEESKKK